MATVAPHCVEVVLSLAEKQPQSTMALPPCLTMWMVFILKESRVSSQVDVKESDLWFRLTAAFSPKPSLAHWQT